MPRSGGGEAGVHLPVPAPLLPDVVLEPRLPGLRGREATRGHRRTEGSSMTRSPKPRKPRKPLAVLRKLDAQLNHIHAGAGWWNVSQDIEDAHALVSELRAALRQTKERR
jgi:hypothetical protein